MPLTDNQCETLRDAILNVYPYENKAALESLLIKEFKLEFTVSYSYQRAKNDSDKTIHKDNKKRKKKIKILFFQTYARDLNLNKEYYEISSAIERASNRSLFDKQPIIFKPVYSIDDIRREIANEEPQIVHFCGHAEDGSLKLENDSNESLVSPEILKSIFEGREDIIKCVLLNACNSAEATVAISHHIDYAIGMNNQIIDGVAIEFAKGFYDGLGFKNNNKDIDIFLRAFNEGIRAIIAKNDSQKLIPVLKKRIRYEDAILNLIKNINAENNIDDFIVNLKSITNLSSDKLFTKFYVDYSYPIKKDDLNQLVEIIRQIKDFNLVKSSYRDTLPQYSTIDNSELNNPVDVDYIIDILHTKYPFVSDKVPSILQFATNLAGKFEENSQEYKDIETWVKKVSSQLGISISVQPKDECSLQELYIYLLIIVDAEGDNKFNLHAEYILEDESLNKVRQEPLNLPDHNEQTGIICDSFNEIPNKVKQYYDELFRKLKPNELKKITVELFLPIYYLTKNLDQEWFIYDDTLGESPIVRELNIVVRPRERLKDKFRIPLQNNFDRFKNSFNKYSDEDILNKEMEIINQKVVDGNYQKISDNFKDKKIGVKLTYNGIPDKAFFRAIIRGATVIAFWRRCSIPENSNSSDIDNYFKLEYFKNDFRNLIEKMHELRKDVSYNDNNENFYSLGFLCDNPNRIPNIKPLQPF